MGIKSKAKHYKQKYTKPGNEYVLFDNIINNDWSTTRPLEKITSNMTCMKQRGRLYDVALYEDAYTNLHNSSIPYYEGLVKVLSGGGQRHRLT